MHPPEKPPRTGAMIRRLLFGGLLGTAAGAAAGLGLGCFLCLLYVPFHVHGYPSREAALFAMALSALAALAAAASGMIIAWQTRPQPPIQG